MGVVQRYNAEVVDRAEISASRVDSPGRDTKRRSPVDAVPATCRTSLVRHTCPALSLQAKLSKLPPVSGAGFRKFGSAQRWASQSVSGAHWLAGWRLGRQCAGVRRCMLGARILGAAQATLPPPICRQQHHHHSFFILQVDVSLAVSFITPAPLTTDQKWLPDPPLPSGPPRASPRARSPSRPSSLPRSDWTSFSRCTVSLNFGQEDSCGGTGIAWRTGKAGRGRATRIEDLWIGENTAMDLEHEGEWRIGGRCWPCCRCLCHSRRRLRRRPFGLVLTRRVGRQEQATGLRRR